MHLKRLITFFSVFLALSQAYASDCHHLFQVHRRQGPDSKIEVLPTCLDNYLSKKAIRFENKVLKVVQQHSNEAISLDRKNHKTTEKAATVFYHLNKAHSFFHDELKINPLKNLGAEKLIARIDIKDRFTDVARFSHPKFAKKVNNAVTIPKSGPKRLEKYNKWGHEIWFRPGKKEKGTSALSTASELLTQADLHQSLAQSYIKTGLQQYSFQAATDMDQLSFEASSHLQTLALTLGVTQVLPPLLKGLGKVVPKNYFLETALIPEIIYHEFVHVAFSSRLPPKTSTPVGEGVANFYASLIAGGSEVAHKAGHRQKGYVKRDAKKDQTYHISLEQNIRAQHNFTFHLLWNVYQNFNDPALAAKIINRSVELYEQGQGLKYGLTNALINSVREEKSIQDTLAVEIQLNKIFTELGL